MEPALNGLCIDRWKCFFGKWDAGGDWSHGPALCQGLTGPFRQRAYFQRVLKGDQSMGTWTGVPHLREIFVHVLGLELFAGH